jgi:hypothetical protein
MDFRERLNDPDEAVRAAFDAFQAKLHTAMPGVIVSYNPATMTAVVQPTIKFEVRGQDGEWRQARLPQIPDVPVQLSGGGGFSCTFPLAAGDEGWLVFAERCIDGWWQNGGVQAQVEHRMHDLSDPAFFPKVRSKPNALNPPPSATTAQLRSDDGTTFVEVTPGGIVNIVAPFGVTVTAPFLNCTGNITALSGSPSSVGLTTHHHVQGADSHGDVEQPTNSPTAGS